MPFVRVTFAPIDEVAARQVASWRYEGPYALYDGDPGGFETRCGPSTGCTRHVTRAAT
jgi:hypothetical protein